MPHFTLKQLKYFVAVVEAESIAEASRQLPYRPAVNFHCGENPGRYV